MLEENILEFFKSKNIIYFKTLDSTQTYASDLVSKNKPKQKTAILTYNQLKGKGQLGATWYSEQGNNISMSLIISPEFLQIEDQFLLSQMTALAVRKIVQRHFQSKVMIKWPNDILIGKRKVAGILINNTLQGSTITTSIIGIGINVNQVKFPSDLPFATSMLLESEIKFDLNILVSELLDAFDEYYEWLKNGKYELLRSKYLEYLYGFQLPLEFILPEGTQICGKILDVLNNGRLKVRTKEGDRTFDIRELKFML